MKIYSVLLIIVSFACFSRQANAQTITAGSSHSLIIGNNGVVWGWGSNEHGELGNLKIKESSMPLKVSNLANVKAVSAGGAYSLALKKDGTVWWCGMYYWHNDELGRRAINKQVNSFAQHKKLAGVTAIATGSDFSLALKNDSTVWAWGMNIYNVLGTGNPQPIETPVKIGGLNEIIAIEAGGGHALALKKDGTVWTWGTNSRLQLGFADGGNRDLPEQVQGLTGIIAISGGAVHSLALKEDGTVWTWGSNSFGALGRGSHSVGERDASPKPVDGLTNVIAIAGGQGHSLALKSDGTVWAWGMNMYGELGTGDLIDRDLPTKINTLTDIVEISTWGEFSIALKKDGTIWAWGHNMHASSGVGDPEVKNVTTPIQVGKSFNVKQGSIKK